MDMCNITINRSTDIDDRNIAMRLFLSLTVVNLLFLFTFIKRRLGNNGYTTAGNSSVAIAVSAGYLFTLSAMEYISWGILCYLACAVAFRTKSNVRVLVSFILLFHSVMFVPSKQMGQ
mgnify:CR=1 FL=1